jgi:hypothetical protein
MNRVPFRAAAAVICTSPRRLPIAGALGLALVVMAPPAATAQVKASEAASITQTVDGTVLTLEYSRPRARGRQDLFGELIPWGEVWTPGANAATRLTVSQDIMLAGVDIPAGSWSMWLVVADGEDWELVLDPRDSLFHTAHPEPTDEQIRTFVQRTAGPPVEVLTWSVPDLSNTGGVLEMAWGTTRIALPFAVQPTLRTVLTAAEAEPFVGSYDFHMTRDTTGARVDFHVRHADDGTLQARTWFPGQGGTLSEFEMMLMPLSDGVFRPGILRDGRLWETLAQIYLEFDVTDGRPTGFVMRGQNDNVFAEGERKEGS